MAIRIRTDVTSKGSRYWVKGVADFPRANAGKIAEPDDGRVREPLAEEIPENAEQTEQGGDAKNGSHPRSALARFDAGIQQHDHEDEQHHHSAGVNDDLRHRDERAAEQQIENSERRHHTDKRERARNRMLLQHHVDGAEHRDGREEAEE